jgi:hypothetical protein
VIELRLSIREVAIGEVGSVERQLVAAGIPPAAFQAGRVKHWFDDEYFYYQYTPREESEIL